MVYVAIAVIVFFAAIFVDYLISSEAKKINAKLKEQESKGNIRE